MASPGNKTSAICTEMLTAVPIMNRAFYNKPTTEYMIMILYAVVITIGCCGNALTIFVTLRKPAMRTNRNLFIANLALADFFLCSVTAPITMYTNLHRYWSYGQLTCRLISGVQAFNVFLSTLSISAIGLDRFIAVMAPTHFSGVKQRYLIMTILLGVWILSIMLSAPLYYVSGLKELLPELNLTQTCGQGVFSCEEMAHHWAALPISQYTYTIAALTFQYVIPLMTLSFVYSQISSRIRRRLQARTGMAPTVAVADSQTPTTCIRQSNTPMSVADLRRSNVTSRSRRTHYLLVMIVMIFGVSWFPFNAYTILYMTNFFKLDGVIFSFAHIVGMTSACSNPILYAVLNENFRKEFIEVWTILRLRFCPCLWSNRLWACSCFTCGDLSEAQIERVIGRRVVIDQPSARTRFYSMPESANRLRLSNDNGLIKEELVKSSKSAHRFKKPNTKRRSQKSTAHSLDDTSPVSPLCMKYNSVGGQSNLNGCATVTVTPPESVCESTGNGTAVLVQSNGQPERQQSEDSVLL